MHGRFRLFLTTAVAALVCLTGLTVAAEAEGVTVRVKDIAYFQGDRINQLTGLGLVVGLAGTGDGSGTQANVQMIANMLQRFGLTLSPNELRTRNVAAVMVTAELPPFAREGDTIDVTVSSFGDAKSLEGGVLLMTPLRGADGQVYAVAQGPVSIGGFNVSGGGSRVQKNHATVGRVPNGATIEVEIFSPLTNGNYLDLILKNPDFTTAARIVDSINAHFDAEIARAVDKSTVELMIPEAYQHDPIAFIARLESVEVTPDATAKVVINERTGTIVMGQNVRISTVAVAHGSLSVSIGRTYEVSQPWPESQGTTQVIPQTEIQASEEEAKMMVLPAGSNVNDVVKVLNAIGATPRDIIAILQAVRAAGALHGELVII
ncbi:MAG: flagellar basal body P-ring protein FlgI [Firmicutes bacterium]|nr:flagellar basal body P-ring protein FlgI [Bacillota bacterium]